MVDPETGESTSEITVMMKSKKYADSPYWSTPLVVIGKDIQPDHFPDRLPPKWTTNNGNERIAGAQNCDPKDWVSYLDEHLPSPTAKVLKAYEEFAGQIMNERVPSWMQPINDGDDRSQLQKLIEYRKPPMDEDDVPIRLINPPLDPVSTESDTDDDTVGPEMEPYSGRYRPASSTASSRKKARYMAFVPYVKPAEGDFVLVDVEPSLPYNPNNMPEPAIVQSFSKRWCSRTGGSITQLTVSWPCHEKYV